MRVRKREREEFIERGRTYLFFCTYYYRSPSAPVHIFTTQVSVLWKFFSRFATKQKEHHGDDDREND